MPIDHVVGLRTNLARNTFLPEHTPGSQVIEVGKALRVRGLLAGRDQRQQQLAAVLPDALHRPLLAIDICLKNRSLTPAPLACMEEVRAMEAEFGE